MNKAKLIENIKQHKKKIAIVLIALLLIGGGSIYGLTSNADTPSLKNGKNNEISTKDKENKTDDNTISSDNEDTKKDTSTSTNNSNYNDNSSADKPADKPACKPSGGDKPSHSYSWEKVYKTVNNPEQGHNGQYVTKSAWTENIPIWGQDERSICNQCGKDITGGESAHNKAHAMAGEPGGWHSEWVDIKIGTDTINHPTEYGTRWVVDKAAWSEQVLDYYKCCWVQQNKNSLREFSFLYG
ncbi:MAG: hypothetical protein RSE56_03240 [Bacilli bacterium]